MPDRHGWSRVWGDFSIQLRPHPDGKGGNRSSPRSSISPSRCRPTGPPGMPAKRAGPAPTLPWYRRLMDNLGRQDVHGDPSDAGGSETDRNPAAASGELSGWRRRRRCPKPRRGKELHRRRQAWKRRSPQRRLTAHSGRPDRSPPALTNGQYTSTPDGHLIWADLSVSCVRDARGQVEFFVCADRRHHRRGRE